MSFVGLANLALSAAEALVPVTVKPYRAVDSLIADAVVREEHQDDLVITEHPVERGSVIADHAYKLPAQVVLTYVWSESGSMNDEDPDFLRNLYEDLLKLQYNRTPLEIFTGKRHYSNMLIISLQVHTDRATEHVLWVRMVCREVLLAVTRVAATSSGANSSDPRATTPVANQGTKQLQPGSAYNGGTQ